jgi:hypothetical protein
MAGLPDQNPRRCRREKENRHSTAMRSIEPAGILSPLSLDFGFALMRAPRK